MWFYRLICASLLTTSSLFAQWQTIGNVDSFTTMNGNQISTHSGKSVLHIHFLAADLVRVRLAPHGTFAPDSSWAVVRKEWPPFAASISETETGIRFVTSEMIVEVNKRPLRLSFLDKEAHILNQDDPSRGMAWNVRVQPDLQGTSDSVTTEVRIWKVMPADEHYYGFGEQAGRFNRKFTHTTMWNSDIPAYKADTDPLYQTIPFFYGIKQGNAYGIFFDNSYRSSFDMGKESRGAYSFGAEAGELNYYFFYGPSPKKVLSRFTELVGRMPLPPRWSLGYQQCRWSYAPESRVREIARTFREKKIPCDVIYLDIDYMDGYRIFTWNPKNFPDPNRMIGDLSRDGFKIAVIVDPGIKADTAYRAYRSGLAGDHFLKYPDGKIYIGKVWPGECAFPDFTNSSTRGWWGSQFSDLVGAGVRGWWNDMNEPSVFDVPTKTVDLDVIHNDNGLMTTHAKNHNVYGRQMTRATNDGVKTLLPNERPFVLTRASYAGGHRYSAAWTGDNIASWEHLKMAVPMCLNLSISGQPFVGTDIGGFIGYPSGELFARWLQLGVFTPLMRAHSVINEKNKEPWEYGAEFTEINRETINLRYQLLPYIYNVMYQASVTGNPAMRPLIFDYPQESDFIWTDTEFMFGDDLLIAPVLSAGATTRQVRLPSGDWFNYWTNTRYEGGRPVTVDAPINRIPIFVKAGAIIPTQQVLQYSDQAPIDPLTLTVYPTDSQFTTPLYEDDGHTFAYEGGSYRKRTINQWNSSVGVTMTISKAEGSYIPPKRRLVLRFIGAEIPPKSVEMNGKILAKLNTGSPENAITGWSYNTGTRQLSVGIEDGVEEMRITVTR